MNVDEHQAFPGDACFLLNREQHEARLGDVNRRLRVGQMAKEALEERLPRSDTKRQTTLGA